MTERVTIEVEYKIRAQIELPEGQDYGDFVETSEEWESALVNDLMNQGDTGEFSRNVRYIRIDTNDHTDDTEWMELNE